MEIQNSLRNFVINEVLEGELPEGFDDNYDLIDSGELDSIKMMNLVTYIEQHHQIAFGINDLVPRNFKSVKALAEYVKSKLK